MSEPAGSPSRALSFGPAATEYDRLRPGYPAQALRWALGSDPLRVVDLGAGTGILSRLLLQLGHDVVPVEPDEGMREQLHHASGGALSPLAGYAEQIPLPDGGVDAVVAGQAYHWFDPEPAHAEVARVLRPGGVFAPIWNHRDESVGWVAELSAVAEDDTAGRGQAGGPRPESFGPWFGPVERAEFHHTVTHTAESLVGLVATRSYYLTAPPQRQHLLAGRVRALCARHPDLAGRETFALPYRTAVYRAARSAD